MAYASVVSFDQCPGCASTCLIRFASEIAIHHPGIENLAVPHVFIFPKLLVCSTCGLTQFLLSKDELGSLVISDAAHG